MSLSDRMSFGHVVESDGKGTITDYTGAEPSPEIAYVELDGDGRVASSVNLDGFGTDWRPLEGFSGQHGYNGPIMHPSEFIDGGLADYILATPGLFVAVEVDGIESPTQPGEDLAEADSVAVGWAVLHQKP